MKAELSHEHVSHLLPWYSNRTLSAEEQAAVEEHLKTCSECQREAPWLQSVSGAMAELAEEAPAPDTSFAQVLAEIDRATKSAPSFFETIRSWLNFLWNPPIPLARLVFAAQLLLIIGLGIYALKPRTTGTEFRTLSGSEEKTGGARLTINFAPDMTVGKMNESLADVGGRIVSGPSVSGMYVVELPIGREKDAEIQAAIEKLRANRGIRFAEREP